MSKVSWFRLKKEAELTYGKASTRPQDVDSDLMISSRRTNLGFQKEFPDNYLEELQQLIKEITVPALQNDETFVFQPKWTNDSNMEAMEWTFEIDGDKVISLDFEFHGEESYDGFICVASLSTGNETYVVDCLGDSRTYATKIISNILQNKEILKPMCGMDNDVIRLRKDWSCFPRSTVDIQDMFVVFRDQSFQECLQMCSETIRAHLRSKNKPDSSDDVMHFLKELNKPGLSFLQQVLIRDVLVFKNPVLTLADWRKRPLHGDLIKYAGNDAFVTYNVYAKLQNKIGESGLREAMTMGLKKLKNTGDLPNYKLKVPLTNDLITHAVIKWREYLAKNLDKKPEQILPSNCLTSLISSIKSNPTIDDKQLLELFAKYNVHDDHEKAASLLLIYLDEDKMQRMQNLICHRCNRQGHTAKFCFVSLTHSEEREAKRCFRERNESKGFAYKQSERRWNKYCAKRGLDPATATKPWMMDK